MHIIMHGLIFIITQEMQGLKSMRCHLNLKDYNMQCSIVLNAWASQMSIKMDLVTDRVFMPNGERVVLYQVSRMS